MKVVFSLFLLALTFYFGPSAKGQSSGGHKPLKVAFVISQGFNMMDFAGPWEVFQDAANPAPGQGFEQADSLFELFTVSDSTSPVKTTGGATVVPAYSFANAPVPDIVVIGAQSSNSAALKNWLKSKYSNGSLVMSVCTGASKLASSGLLDGLPATTHHDYLANFEKSFPRTKWQPSKRYVKSADRLYTAGGLTSGIDLALHVVADKFGENAAKSTAEYMEYSGQGWR